MTSSFTRSPKLLRGAFAVYPSMQPGTTPQMVVFQYNPEQMRRTLASRAPQRPQGDAEPAREDVLRVLGPPVETVNLSVVLDAADQLEHPDSHRDVVEHGLHPALATLELLLYPSSESRQEMSRSAERGEVMQNPPDIPLTLLVWGQSRVVPVMLTGFSVTEEAFDPNLNPVRATVELGLKILTYFEMPPSTVGVNAFVAYQRQKEQLAGKYRSADSTEQRKLLNF